MKSILFNPFRQYRETILLAFGAATMIAGSILAWIFETHYDSIFHVHYAISITFYHPFIENIINIVTLTILLYLVAIYLNRKTRLVDILATCLVARTPIYILSLFNINHFMGHLNSQMIKNIAHHAQVSQILGVVPITVMAIVSILVFIWYIVLLYQGFKVDSNASGLRANILFIVALILAEIVSKYLITFI